MTDLRKYISSVGWKRLSSVETDPGASNQHELNGVSSFQLILGRDRLVGLPALFLYVDDTDAGVVRDEGALTWYDAREAHPTRSEFRLYYSSNAVTRRMQAADLLVVARMSEAVLVIVCAGGSTAESQIAWLFDLDLDFDSSSAHAREVGRSAHRSEIAVRTALESLGLEVPREDRTHDWQVEEFELWTAQGEFPSTSELSHAAQRSLGSFSELAIDDPDAALLAVLDREEAIFRALEDAFVSARIAAGFVTVDEFVTYSLSVQNRRKSRAGRAFEFHLEELFHRNRLRFATRVQTERRARPDFIFPGAEAYADPDFPSVELDMLGAKTSCKDRWRQVLAEADRVARKHLVTLEPAISENQTDEMRAHSLRLVMPRAIRETCSKAQRDWVMSVADFIWMRRAKG